VKPGKENEINPVTLILFADGAIRRQIEADARDASTSSTNKNLTTIEKGRLVVEFMKH